MEAIGRRSPDFRPEAGIESPGAVSVVLMSESASPTPHAVLARRIGLGTAIAVTVGSTIGSGIFRSPSGIAEQLPGPVPMLLCWAIAGLLALCGALTLAEVGSAHPETGGSTPLSVMPSDGYRLSFSGGRSSS